MEIRRATEDDFEALWPIFRAVIATGDTYVFAPETSREEAFAYWFGPGVASYVAEEEGRIVGMYKIIPNQRDLDSHVANASFMVDPTYGGRGAGRAMGMHCLREARRADMEDHTCTDATLRENPRIALHVLRAIGDAPS
jgi:L-amino acid N-acyltransferase YncA